MNYIKFILLALLFSSLSCLATDKNFGVAASQNGVLCVSYGEKHPQIGSSVIVIETQSPQYFFEGKLGAESENCNVLEKADIPGPYFTITSHKKVSEPFSGISVSNAGGIAAVNNEVQLSAVESKEKIYFRSCTSHEGLHFSSWLGKPLSGKQLWQVYFYLGYDVEPSCEDKDFPK
jgi:hypothetical protein